MALVFITVLPALFIEDFLQIPDLSLNLVSYSYINLLLWSQRADDF